MKDKSDHKWIFRSRFRRDAFGWRSQPAILRIKEAISEIKKMARKEAVLGAEGAVLFLEKVSPALQHVDSSSGAIGTAVNNAIEALVPIIAKAPADDCLRDKWLKRLWDAIEDDNMPYIEILPDYWGELCVTPERASKWADEFIDIVKMIWSPNSEHRGHYIGIIACLSALLKAGRNEEILDLLESEPNNFWHYRVWGVRALEAIGQKSESIAYAEKSGALNDNSYAKALASEEFMLSSGMVEEAYQRYAIKANQKTTYQATFRAIAKKYPNKPVSEILCDLVNSTPGEEGKWFAAAKSAGLYREAIDLANRTPCDPKTLIRAARDMVSKEPRFSIESGIAALRWLLEGYGYEITGLDVWAAYDYTMKAAVNAGCVPETRARIKELVAKDIKGERFVTKVLGKELGVSR